MHIADLFDLEGLAASVEGGFVRAQVHPADPTLTIYNYTEAATYGRQWDHITTTCRGLIVNGAGTVVARPLPKFWNVGEHPDGALSLSDPVEVTEKLDGSLGILYLAPDGLPAVATRGSFASEQAEWATKLYRAEYVGEWTPDPAWTYLFEIVYAANRIVVEYNVEDLFLLGAVHIETGRSIGPVEAAADAGWPGPVAEVHPYRTLVDALTAPQRDNAEGYVIRYLRGAHADMRVKLKHDRYVSLPRLLTGLTARRLWERAAICDITATGEEIGFACPPRQIAQILRMDPADVKGVLDAGPDWDEEVKRTAPEEFWEWIETTTDGLHERVAEILSLVAGEALGQADRERRDVARAIADHPYRGMVFMAIDGKPYLAQAWAAVRPAAEKPFAARSEDVA